MFQYKYQLHTLYCDIVFSESIGDFLRSRHQYKIKKIEKTLNE